MSRKVNLFDDAEWDRLDSSGRAAKSESSARVEWIHAAGATIQNQNQRDQVVAPTSAPHLLRLRRHRY